MGLAVRCLFLVVERQIIDEAAQHQQRIDIIFESEVGDAGLGVVRHRTTEFLRCDFFVRHRLDHIRAGHEHVRGVLDHEDEVGHRWRIHGTTCAGAHDHGDLRHHAGSQHVALKHIGITTKRSHTFLNTCATGVVETDHRGAYLHRMIHDLANLLRMRFGERAAEHREVLRENKHHTAIDGAVADHHAVTGNLGVSHVEVGTAVLNEHVPFFERTWIEQQFDALASSQLALGMLRVDTFLAATKACRRALVV